MILCVTLNPCVDKTLDVPSWQPGDSVRGKALLETAGGKGNNVARALSRLGRPSRPVLPLGGAAGARAAQLLRVRDGLDPLVIDTQAGTRVILTVRSEGGPQTAFFDPDPALAEEEVATLVGLVERTLKAEAIEALCLCGSSPAPAADGAFADLIAIARARRVPVFLDTYGPALDAIWGFWPEAIHLNRAEAGLLLGVDPPSDDQIVRLLERFERHGVRLAVITDGPGPVWARGVGQTYIATPAAVDVVNPIGAGDSFLAGMVDGWFAGRDSMGILRRALACAADAVATWEAGAIDPERVDAYEDQIAIDLTEANHPTAAPPGRRQHRVG